MGLSIKNVSGRIHRPMHLHQTVSQPRFLVLTYRQAYDAIIQSIPQDRQGYHFRLAPRFMIHSNNWHGPQLFKPDFYYPPLLIFILLLLLLRCSNLSTLPCLPYQKLSLAPKGFSFCITKKLVQVQESSRLQHLLLSEVVAWLVGLLD